MSAAIVFEFPLGWQVGLPAAALLLACTAWLRTRQGLRKPRNVALFALRAVALLTLVFVFYPLITERPAESVSQEMDIEAQILSLRKRNVPAGAVNDREENINPLADAEERISKLRKQNLASQGTPRAQISKSRQGKNKECPKCGSANPADARFCSECASKLTKDR